MESDALLPGSLNWQIVYEVDFESLFGPPEIALNSNIRRPYSFSESQNISGPPPLIPPFYSNVQIKQQEVPICSCSIC